MESDSELVAWVRRGELEAFGRLIERYEKTLLATAVRELRDFHAAEDVVQASLLLAFRRIGTLRDADKFGPWLIQIARRQLVDVVRDRRLPVSTACGDQQCESHHDSDAHLLIEHEHLLKLVAQLPEHESVLVGLRYFDGHSMSEIAKILSRPLGTVTKQLSRAIARLRSWYEQESMR